MVAGAGLADAEGWALPNFNSDGARTHPDRIVPVSLGLRFSLSHRSSACRFRDGNRLVPSTRFACAPAHLAVGGPPRRAWRPAGRRASIIPPAMARRSEFPGKSGTGAGYSARGDGDRGTQAERFMCVKPVGDGKAGRHLVLENGDICRPSSSCRERRAWAPRPWPSPRQCRSAPPRAHP